MLVYLPYAQSQSIIPCMNQRTFLYQLQAIDTDIDKLNQRLNDIHKILEFNEDIIAVKHRIELLDLQLRNQNHSLKKISDEAQFIQSKISTSEQSLYDGSIKNPKELQGVNAEIESLKKRLSTLDEEQFEYLIQIETLEEELLIHNNELNKLEQSKSQQKTKFQSEIEEIHKEINRLNIEKKPVLTQIDEEFLKIYTNLRKTKNKIAVSKIVDNACSMCGNSLPPMEVQKARGPIDDVFCSVCKRFLVW
jgi:predicted  nucleic acid-binding Zn-ribbon protein